MTILEVFHAVVGLLGASFGDVEKKLDERASGERLDWRRSVVDLLKTLKRDSSLNARKKMASEAGYTGKLDGSAEMNTWLHSYIMCHLKRFGVPS